MTTTAIQNDKVLHDAIMDELAWSPEVNSERIGVAVTDGAVALSGEVSTFPEKEAAVDAALRVRGVVALADEITVRNPAHPVREDGDIARDVRHALINNISLPPNKVTAEVHDHAVTLMGKVPWRYQRDAAKNAVAAVPGVHSVLNLIEVLPMSPIPDANKAKAKITSAIMRHAQLDANQIKVAVSGNKVTLTGEVSTWPERREAERAAWALPGVQKVENLIKIFDRTS